MKTSGKVSLRVSFSNISYWQRSIFINSTSEYSMRRYFVISWTEHVEENWHHQLIRKLRCLNAKKRTMVTRVEFDGKLEKNWAFCIQTSDSMKRSTMDCYHSFWLIDSQLLNKLSLLIGSFLDLSTVFGEMEAKGTSMLEMNIEFSSITKLSPPNHLDNVIENPSSILLKCVKHFP